MTESLYPILPLPRQTIPRRSHGHVDRDHFRAWDIAGPLFKAGGISISISKMPKYHGDKHVPVRHRINLVVQGTMEFRCGSRILTAHKGDLVFTPAGVSLQRTGIGPIIWLFIELEDIPMWEPLKEAGPYMRTYESADLMYILARRITDAIRRQDVSSIHVARESSQVMVMLLKREFRNSINGPSKRMSHFVDILERIRAHPEKDWSRDVLAKELHVSERTLIREFKKIFNIPPSQMVSTIRMDMAARMLINADQYWKNRCRHRTCSRL